MNHKIHNVGAAEKIGRYSDAIKSVWIALAAYFRHPGRT